MEKGLTNLFSSLKEHVASSISLRVKTDEPCFRFLVGWGSWSSIFQNSAGLFTPERCKRPSKAWKEKKEEASRTQDRRVCREKLLIAVRTDGYVERSELCRRVRNFV